VLEETALEEETGAVLDEAAALEEAALEEAAGVQPARAKIERRRSDALVNKFVFMKFPLNH
jgi:hypothetical protein